MLIIYILFGLLINILIGTIVFAVIDKDYTLYAWFERRPPFIGFFVLSGWPVILFYYLRKNKF